MDVDRSPLNNWHSDSSLHNAGKVHSMLNGSSPLDRAQLQSSTHDDVDSFDERVLFKFQYPQPEVILELTLVVAFDEEYVAKLRRSWPTWMRFRLRRLRGEPLGICQIGSHNCEAR
jgi:hypothetical protein